MIERHGGTAGHRNNTNRMRLYQGSNMYLVKENDVYKREREVEFSLEEVITFKLPEEKVYPKHQSDWYINVALEKSDLVKVDRHLLTHDLLVEYRWAIREGYNHGLDPALKRSHDFPRNRNTVEGIKKYIALITKRSEDEMREL